MTTNCEKRSSLLKEFDGCDLTATGRELHAFAAGLYPICRSITGNGIRETLRRIHDRIPLEVTEVPTGTQVFDWTIPDEWNIRDAYIKDASGNRIVNFQSSNLHVVNYSTPVFATLAFAELEKHLHTLPDQPDLIPYRTSYYRNDWGFCLPHNQKLDFKQGSYEVCIDSTLAPGFLSYGECYLPGESSEEVLISTHSCHPSLANDNLSGITIAVALAKFLCSRKHRYSYRFLFAPGTIGAITWLARNRENVGRIRHGLVLTGIGDSNGFHYKKSRRGNAEIDLAMAHVLRHCNETSEILEFSPYGYDERQYCSPGFNLSVGCLMRSIWGQYPEYHTSADNLEFIRPEQLAASLRVCIALIDVLEGNRRYQNLSPYCEVQLGKRGLYGSSAGSVNETEISARLWVLNLSDGNHSVLDIAERSGIEFSIVRDSAELLRQNGLLELLLEPNEKNQGVAGSPGSSTPNSLY
jgi:aminopeptidase-like protein